MIESNSISKRRKAVLRTLLTTLKAEAVVSDHRTLPYPIGIPELNEHLDLLCDIADRSPEQVNPEEIRARICDSCPHQFPSRYCALRTGGTCTPFRHVETIVAALRHSSSSERRNSQESPHAS